MAEADIQTGDRLFVPRLRTEATVLEAPSRGKVRVQAGALKLWVDVADVRAGMSAVPRASTPNPSANESEPRRADPRSIDNTLDLRGMRVDDALTLTESFLDRVYGQNGATAYIVHGMGSGALRDAVREQLGRDKRYVASFRGGETSEGGERVTVVTLQ